MHFENLVFFVPFLIAPLTSDPGLPYWPSGLSRNSREISENRSQSGDAFAGPQKRSKVTFFRARFQVTLLHMGYFGSLLRCDTKVTVLRIPTKKSETFGLKSRDLFWTRALNHLNLFEVPMPEPPRTWCFPAEFSGFSGDLAKNAFDTSEATGFVGAFSFSSCI